MVNVLYFFSGQSRKCSLKACLEALSDERTRYEVTEVDIVHGKEHDLSHSDVRAAWLEKIKAGRYHVVLVTPPCSTFSRVRMANRRGPLP